MWPSYEGTLLAVPAQSLDALAPSPVLTHGDMHPANTLKDGFEEFVLVDSLSSGSGRLRCAGQG